MAEQFFSWIHNHVRNSNSGTGHSNSVTGHGDLTDTMVNLNSVPRDTVHQLFLQFLGPVEKSTPSATAVARTGRGNESMNTKKAKDNAKNKRSECGVMTCLKQKRLLKTKRYNDGIVLCCFADVNTRKFSPFQDRRTARDEIRQKFEQQMVNKHGVVVAEQPTMHNNNSNDQSQKTLQKGHILPSNSSVELSYNISYDKMYLGGSIVDTALVAAGASSIFPAAAVGAEVETSSGRLDEDEVNAGATDLVEVVITGPHKNQIKIHQQENRNHHQQQQQATDDLQRRRLLSDLTAVRLTVQTHDTGVIRANILFKFQRFSTSFSILRTLFLRVVGDPALYEALKPTSPYTKKNLKKKTKYDYPTKKEDVFRQPKQPGSHGQYHRLGRYNVPIDVREMVAGNEVKESIQKPDFETPSSELGELYTTFWQKMLWISELQSYDDIKLFDMEDAPLTRHGRNLLKLHVPGLAEGRPSVLRGDIVVCKWRGKEYRGRVVSIELLNVVLEFHQSFHKEFHVQTDRVDLIRFTFSRTSYRTCHQGIVSCWKGMTSTMLMPLKVHAERIQQISHQRNERVVPDNILWASPHLNDEQRAAVTQIVKATLRPLPYMIYGPPGTGKSSTLTEAVYQLARIHKYNEEQKRLKILVVAPSNDAADIIVEKLSVYFPPSEMIRVLAYTRTLNQVPVSVRPYCKEGLELSQLRLELESFSIVVATVNLAARFTNLGTSPVSKGYFDVIGIDEAGHATEPEVIGVVSTLMKCRGKDVGQLIMAGDPRQLGPIVTSAVCKEFGMGMSYMERLLTHSPLYSTTSDCITGLSAYPPELVTMLTRNYRSHESIIKLPNDMFYDTKLVACGDRMVTNSMARWEHFPTTRSKDFPIMFHSIDGENLREGKSPSWFNPQEATVVVDYVDRLINQSRPPVSKTDIGIITPYARQVQKIRLALKTKGLDDDRQMIKVGSVECFQGQERRCIIISTVRSEESLLSHDQRYNLGFVASPKRFNVAVTRAKALLVVVGNPRVLSTDTKHWLPFLRYCKNNKAWIGDEWDDDECKNDADDIGGDSSNDGSGIVIDTVEDDDWDMVDAFPRGYINREE